MSSNPLPLSQQIQQPPAIGSPQVPEKYLMAFVIQGDDVFKITADNIVHTIGTADGPAFDAIAKLKAAAALLELTNRHKERPDELRKMARELAGEGMKLMARASSAFRPRIDDTPAARPDSGTVFDPDAADAKLMIDDSMSAIAPEDPVAPQDIASVPAPSPLALPVPTASASQAPVLPPRPEQARPGTTPSLGSSRIALISS